MTTPEFNDFTLGLRDEVDDVNRQIKDNQVPVMTLNLVRDRELEAATTPLPPSSISPSVEVRVVDSTTPFDAGRPLTTEDHRILAKVKKKNPFPLRENDMPPHDAMENVLPEYQYIFKPEGRGPPGQIIGGPVMSLEEGGQQSVQLLDYQMRELEKYRTAVHRMGQDILSLRQQVRDLEAQNGSLRHNLSSYSDTTRMLMDSQNLDGLTKSELAAKYVTLKQRLTGQTSELKSYKERVQKLQNELIKRNDSEKQLILMNRAHKSQNDVLHKLQEKADKVKRYEEAMRKQEKVIEKLERVANKAPINRGESHDVLLDENRRLRQELENLRSQTRKLEFQDTVESSDEQKLEMYQRLEKSDRRVLALESQLSDNARKWGKERADLITRLQEAENGLRGTLSSVPTPRLQSHEIYREPQRYSKPSFQHSDTSYNRR